MNEEKEDQKVQKEGPQILLICFASKKKRNQTQGERKSGSGPTEEGDVMKGAFYWERRTLTGREGTRRKKLLLKDLIALGPFGKQP